MEEIDSRRVAKNYFFILTGLFLIAQVLFLIDVEVVGNEDILGGIILTCVFLLFIALTIKGYLWAKWTLSVLLILFGTLFLFAGFEIPSLNLKIVGLYYYLFGLLPHFSQRLKPITITKPKTPSNKSETLVLEGLRFPYLLDRYKAMLIDGLLILALITICLLINSELDLGSTWIFILYAVIVISYEPLLITYKYTIGQKVMKIRVRSINNTDKNINLGQAYLRFLTKALLGWLSFLTISFNKEKRAIHDFTASSIVIKV